MTTTIIEGLLATIFTLSGTIIYLFKNKLKSKLSWLTDYSPNVVLIICLSKIIGALGLILPIQFNFLPILSTIAALGLAAIMILATAYHLRKNQYKDLPATIILLALLLLTVYNRF